MKVKFILPALTEAGSPFWRPIKYSLFPPIGLATLAAYLDPADEAEIVDQHVEALSLDDEPDIVAIEVYITNAYRAFTIADHYRQRGVFVILGGIHVSALPEEAAKHADAIFIGPAEESFPRFLADSRNGRAAQRYVSRTRTLVGIPPVRRDLIKRERYLVPNSIVVTRGCPHHCDFCYKDAFFAGGISSYTQTLDDALGEIGRLPGRHLYFLDDHLFGNPGFARDLFMEMEGMGRIFQGAATVDSILRGDLVERAADAGLRSIFVGFETLNPANLAASNKTHNLNRDYQAAIERLHDLGVMINGSFVFGLDGDTNDVFKRTVDWSVEMGITTATFHIATPYPGTRFHRKMTEAGRMLTDDWNLYDTRHVTFSPVGMGQEELESGYRYAYREFYRWSAILRSSLSHGSLKHQLKHFFYTSGWKKFEPVWNLIIQARKLRAMTPLLEAILAKVTNKKGGASASVPLAGAQRTAREQQPVGKGQKATDSG
ncbi:MAG: B12-binding domain-containing radical SAM protein [Victivallales bacterium]|nr:B12-binding domain-containing radical SAM protein [Victivallales bacterium]